MSAWGLTARPVDGCVQLRLTLRDPFGNVLEWCEVPLVRPGRPREALLAASVVASASRGAVSRGTALRLLRERGAA